MSPESTFTCGSLLAAIESPSDLRKLTVEQLPQLCHEIRQFLIHSLADNPGHFASSIGAVELTVALHYVFDTPYDRLVWDVGHQAYGHKLLTGRRDRFSTNRTFGGLSGFPNPDESEYDTFAAGHASNSISAALGMAVASLLKNETPRRNVVAITGDASISGGLAFEGLNNASNTPNNLLIVLNDNDMSIDRNVGALNGYLAHLTTSRLYNDLRYKVFKLMKKLHLVTDSRRGALLRFNNSLKSLISKHQNIFEGLNIRYFGPFDGHDIVTLVRVLSDIRDMEGPDSCTSVQSRARDTRPPRPTQHHGMPPAASTPLRASASTPHPSHQPHPSPQSIRTSSAKPSSSSPAPTPPSWASRRQCYQARRWERCRPPCRAVSSTSVSPKDTPLLSPEAWPRTECDHSWPYIPASSKGPTTI